MIHRNALCISLLSIITISLNFASQVETSSRRPLTGMEKLAFSLTQGNMCGICQKHEGVKDAWWPYTSACIAAHRECFELIKQDEQPAVNRLRTFLHANGRLNPSYENFMHRIMITTVYQLLGNISIKDFVAQHGHARMQQIFSDVGKGITKLQVNDLNAADIVSRICNNMIHA